MAKKVDGKTKGKNREREVCSDLTKRFKKDFIRNPAYSGALAARIKNDKKVSNELVTAIAGDIVCPDGFKFSVECKHYKEFDFFTIWNEGSLINKWWEQTKKAAGICSKEPLVLFKFNHKKKMAMLPQKYKSNFKNKIYVCINDEFIIITQDDLFSLEDTFFYE